MSSTVSLQDLLGAVFEVGLRPTRVEVDGQLLCVKFSRRSQADALASLTQVPAQEADLRSGADRLHKRLRSCLAWILGPSQWQPSISLLTSTATSGRRSPTVQAGLLLLLAVEQPSL